MSDLRKYIAKRKLRDPKFAKGFVEGYEEFKIGAIIKSLRNAQRLTQEELAQKLGSKKSAISRLENHAEDVKLSTLAHLAEVFGKQLKVEFVDRHQ